MATESFLGAPPQYIIDFASDTTRPITLYNNIDYKLIIYMTDGSLFKEIPANSSATLNQGQTYGLYIDNINYNVSYTFTGTGSGVSSLTTTFVHEGNTWDISITVPSGCNSTTNYFTLDEGATQDKGEDEGGSKKEEG